MGATRLDHLDAYFSKKKYVAMFLHPETVNDQPGERLNA